MKQRRVIHVVLFLQAVFLLSLLPQVQASEVQTRITFTTNPASGKAEEKFSGYDKIYALITLAGLRPGIHEATVNWVDPTGQLNQQSTTSFTLANQESYTFFAWLKLMENGPMKSTFSGRDFDDQYIGRWEFHLFLDKTLVQRTGFNIY